MLEGFLGQDLDSSDQLLVLETCGQALHVPKLASGGLLTLMASGTKGSWASASLTGAGGLYHLCWCGGLGNASTSVCRLAADFRTTLGSLSLSGPTPLTQDRTCVSGQTCALNGLTGHSLPANSNFLVLETCGMNFEPGRLPGELAATVLTPTEDDVTTLAVSFGSISISAAGGEYRLCWCGAADFNLSSPPAPNSSGIYSSACGTPDDFRLDVGRLTIIGMHPLSQDRTCISGSRCAIYGLTGKHLSGNDRVAVLDTCGMLATFVHGNHAVGASLVMSSGVGASAEWTGTPLSVPGGQYRLCWCAGAATCSTAEYFVQDFGELTVVGITPMPQTRTCVSGRRCAIDGLKGRHLSQTDRWLVLDTCSSFSEASSLQSQAYALEVTGDGSVRLDWGSLPITVGGGQYRLCWCAGALLTSSHSGNSTKSSNSSELSFPCGQWSSTPVYVGDLTVVGPPRAAGYIHCTSGMPCAIDQIRGGQHLSVGDAFLIMDTCGASWQQATGVPAFTGAALAGEVHASGSFVSWGSAAVTALGGEYRLCWCAGGGFPCSTFEAFTVDVGALLLAGPSSFSQHRTCVAGRSCRIERIIGERVMDRSLEDVSRIRIRAYGDGLRDPESFSIFSGDSIQGPWEELGNFSMYSGFDTAQEFSGWQASAASYFKLTFSTSQQVDAANSSLRLRELQFLGTWRGQKRWSQDATWVVAVEPETSQAASVAATTLMDGDVTTWWPSVDVASNASLSIVVDFGSGDQLLVLETCGQQATEFSRPLQRMPQEGGGIMSAWGSTALTTAGGIFRLCWCPLELACSISEHFRLDVGSLEIVGPKPLQQDRTCIAGRTCSVSFQGHLLGTGDAIMLLDTCGAYFGDQHGLPGPVLMAQNSVADANLMYSWNSTPPMAHGGTYRLCWCAGSWSAENSSSWFGPGTCSTGTDFRVDMGEMTIIGPSPRLDIFVGSTAERVGPEAALPRSIFCQDWTWGAGYIMHSLQGLRDRGFVLSTSNDEHFVCVRQHDGKWYYDSDGVYLGFTPRFGDVLVASVDFTADRISSLENRPSTPAASLDGVELGYSRGDLKFSTSGLGEFQVTGSYLQMVAGPQDRTCVSGRTCKVENLWGVALSDNDRVLILETCGLPSSAASRIPEDFGAVDSSMGRAASVSFGSLPLSGAGGSYRLCWCTGGDSFQCTAAEDFIVDAGSLTLIGPAPLAQHRTCVSGQSCAFGGITGRHLLASDSFLVLDTCGQPAALVPNFPDSGIVASLSASGASVSWSDVAITAAGGTYRLCWCTPTGSPAEADLLLFVADGNNSMYTRQISSLGVLSVKVVTGDNS